MSLMAQISACMNGRGISPELSENCRVMTIQGLGGLSLAITGCLQYTDMIPLVGCQMNSFLPL